MKLRILFLLLPILIFSQKINWQSKVELNTDDKYHFESSFENFESSFLQQNKIQVNLPVDSSNFENFVFYKQNPFSEKLELRNRENRQASEIMIAGLLLIWQKKHPIDVSDMLTSYIEPKDRFKYFSEKE